ncbi:MULTISPECIES: sensor histidine kinase [unclassified Janthinobacterium]|uniref:sensor histidine kinase n=1 Tax=unclassified Janthinobacterium TaxID=2610881 RepID=UPI001C59A0CF|nr:MULTISPECIES: histidine kinase [unclassified Janthinobacterium]QYG07783.1 histidine kinase [Janthinobacterium sp. PAMC25594]
MYTLRSVIDGLRTCLSARRLCVAGLAALFEFALFTLSWEDPLGYLAMAVFLPALAALLAYGLFERWPRRLPGRLAHWVLQVVGVALAIMLTLASLYLLNTKPGAPPFWQVPERLQSYISLAFLGLLLGPWTAMAALLRQRDARVREAERRRGELERQARDARVWLLQAQVQPHFLFNTLASLQALLDAGSSHAAPVLAHLVTYLRAAVPRLNEAATRLEQELEMVRAYLVLMQMRMPDRLQFGINVAPGCERLQCPPMTLMTLVENAVRHGIDPCMDGGRIDVLITEAHGRCHIEVSDTGAGLQAGSPGLGTGLGSLRERLALMFGGEAALRISELAPHGFRVSIECPAWP